MREEHTSASDKLITGKVYKKNKFINQIIMSEVSMT